MLVDTIKPAGEAEVDGGLSRLLPDNTLTTTAGRRLMEFPRSHWPAEALSYHLWQ